MGIDWSKAPEGAEFYADRCFRKLWHVWSDEYEEWRPSVRKLHHLEEYSDYEENPETQVAKEWPEETRIDIISTNGCDGLHYNRNADEALGAELSVYAKPAEPKTSAEFLNACAAVQSERGKQYDASGTGERSFAAAASAFNAATGKSLTGSDVCLLLTMVKLVRQYSSPDRLHHDSLLDGVSYLSLWAEELTKELGK
jgi:hypothetical protein